MEKELVALFKVGDRVVSKSTGLPVAGTVSHIVDYQTLVQHAPTYTRISFDASYLPKYPDWREKYSYYVIFDKPQKPITKEELLKGLPHNWFSVFQNMDAIADLLYEEVKEVYMASYPEEDLELL